MLLMGTIYVCDTEAIDLVRDAEDVNVRNPEDINVRSVKEVNVV